MTQVIANAVQLGGMPVPQGGGIRLVEALAGIIRDAGGELRTNADVDRVLIAGGRAEGVRLLDGEQLYANRAVIASVTPTQLYGRLLLESDAPPEVWRSARGFRYGRAGTQIHLALSEPPDWAGPEAERLARTAIVHLTPGMDGVSRAVNEAERGLLPAEATVVVGQPCAVDPSAPPRAAGSSGSSCRSCRAGRAATPPVSSTSGTAPGPRSSARPTPTASPSASDASCAT